MIIKLLFRVKNKSMKYLSKYLQYIPMTLIMQEDSGKKGRMYIQSNLTRGEKHWNVMECFVNVCVDITFKTLSSITV